MTDKKRKSFVLHIDVLSVLDDLTDEQAGKLFKAIKANRIDEEIELDAITKIAFSPFKAQFARDDEKYQNIVDRNKNNGSKGGRPKNPGKAKESEKTQSVNSKPKKADSDSVSDKDSVSDSDNKDLLANANCENAKHCSPKQVVDLYNKSFTGLYPRQMRELTANRASTIRARIKNDIQDLSEWGDFFEWLKQSDFLMGRVQSHNRKPFQMSLDWICKAENMASILEQKYHG